MKLVTGKNLSLMAQFSLLLVFAFVFVAVLSASAATLKVGWIVYNGDWNADSSAPNNLASQLKARTGQDVTVDFVRLDSIDNVKQYDILILTGHNYFSFSNTERAVLKAYLERCGLLFIDDCNHQYYSGFEVSARAEMLNILGVGLSPLPSNHEVFSSFYSLGGTPPTEWNNKPLEGIIIDGSTKVIFSDNDYTCGWENYAYRYTIENSYKVGVNLVMYAASKAQCIAGECVQPPSGLISWWPGDGNAEDIIDGNNGTLMGGAAFATGKVGDAFSFDGQNDWVMVPDDPSLNFGTNDFTVTYWVNFRTTPYGSVTIEKYVEGTPRTGWTLPTGPDTMRLHLADQWPSWRWNVLDVSLPHTPLNTWNFVTMTRSGNTYTIYWNGVPVGSRTFPITLNLDTPSTLKFGHRGNPTDTPGSWDWRGFYLNGLMDEVAFFNRALTAEEIAAIYSAGGAGMCIPENLPPTADAGSDQTKECASLDGTQVTLDGSGSTDPDGDELTYAWTWDGGGAEGVTPTVTLPYGTTTVTLTVSDGKFEDSDEVNITVEDTTPPSTSAILEGVMGQNGWYVSDVDVELTAVDSCTGVRDVHYTITGPGHDGSETTVEGDTANFTLGADGTYEVTYWAVDNAGNVEVVDTGNVEGVNREHNPPAVTPVLPPEPPSGYYTSCVNVRLETTDSASGAAATEYWDPVEKKWKPYDDTVGIPVCSTTTVKYRSTSPAGNVHENTVEIKIDQTPPTITATVEPPANANGWHNTDVTVTFTCSDDTSGVAECTAPITVTTEGAGQVVTGTAKDNAGNEATTSVTLNIDQTPPTITATVQPAANANGWHNTDVTVTFTCADDTSGVAECTAPITVTTEGAGQVVTGTAVDKAGNTATASVTLDIDKTAPVADISLSPGLLWPPNHKMVDVAVNGGASDATSEVASVEFTVADEYGKVEPEVGGFNTSISLEAWREGGDRDGRHYSITAVITDIAGNTTTVTTEAVVPHDMRGKK